MRTVVTIAAGEFQIIRCFDTAVIDPFATTRANRLTYFTPKVGEFFIDDSEFERLSKIVSGAKPGQVVTRQGEVISVLDTMTETEIEAARKVALDSALETAAREKSKLEIAGAPAALATVQKWYQDQVKAINAYYDYERDPE